MNKMKTKIFTVFLICFSPIAVMAGDFDGSKTLICAVIETFECVPGGECQRGLAESIDIPQFLRIDFDSKKISGATTANSTAAAPRREAFGPARVACLGQGPWIIAFLRTVRWGDALLSSRALVRVWIADGPFRP